MFSNLRVVGITAAVVLLSFVTSFSFGQATVTSDKPDYAPLSTAVFTGSGFYPGEEVILKVKNLNRPCNTVTSDSSYLPWTVIADSNGAFVTNWLVCDCIGDSLRLKATGQTSGLIAYAYFTDANVTFSATGLPSGTPTITATYRVFNPNNNHTASSDTRIFSYPGPSSPAISVNPSQSIEYSFSTVTVSGITYAAPSGVVAGSSNAGAGQTITAVYASICTAPTIAAQPSNAAITYGDNAIFTLQTSGTVPTSYTWQVKTTPAGTFSNVSGTNYTVNSTDGTLTITKPTVAMSGYQYRVVLSACTPALTAASNGNATLNVTPFGLTGSFLADNKVYDATNAAVVTTGSRAVATVFAGDAVSLSGGTATFSDKTVANGKTVTLTGAVLSGADAGNYSLTAVTTTTANITAFGLTGSFLADNKVYDATNAAVVTAGSRAVATVFAGDAVSLSGGTATFSDKTVANGKTVTLTGAVLSGADAGNYSLTAVTTTTANITAFGLTGSFLADNKVYDATNAAVVTAGSRAVATVFAGDAVSLSGGTATFSDKTVANGKTVTLTGAVLSGADAGNYSLTAVTTTTANITAFGLTGSFLADNKVYDATNAAVVTTGSRAVATVFAGDAVSLSGGTATFSDKTVANGKTVTLTGAVLSGADAGNYSLTAVTTTTANITAFGLTGSFLADNKVYDATNAAVVTTGSRAVATVFAGDAVSLSGGTATFSDKTVANGKTVTLTGAVLSGADAGNYSLTAVTTTTANITAFGLTGSFLADNKVYDATNAAVVTAGSRAVATVFAGDAVSLSGGTATFSDKTVANGKTVTLTGAVLSGADAGNYSLTAVTTTTANITAFGLTGSFLADNKVYDATNAAVVTAGSRAVATVFAGDAVSLSGGTATFSDKTVANGKTVTLTGAVLSGADAGNYSLTAVTTTTANITAFGLTGSFLADNKVYDATNAAVVTAGSRAVATVFAGDAVSLSGGTATFSDKTVANGKTVTLTGAVLSGADAGNYSLTAVTTTTANITAFGLTGSFLADNKVYDATNAAVVTTGSRAVATVFAGDAVSLSGGTATFSDKTVANGKTVTLTGAVLSGADAGNYSLTAVTTTTANITAFGLTGSFLADNKVYDATNAAVVTAGSRAVATVFAGDAVSLSGGTATFSDKTVANGKTVTLTGAVLSGADAGNYSLTAVTTTTANITAFGLTGSFLADNKVYDATNAAVVTTGSRAVATVFAGDAVSLSGGTATFSDKTVANGKTVILTGAVLSGADAGNYSLTAVTTTTANITARSLTVTALGINKVYDFTTTATVTLSDNRISGDVLTSSYTSANFDNASIGTNKQVVVNGISMSGVDANNYFLTSTAATTTANITAANSTIATVTISPNPVQYSDLVSFKATITSTTAQAALNSTGGVIKFSLKQGTNTIVLGSSEAGDWSVNGSGILEINKSFAISQAPETYTVIEEFTPTNTNITGVTNFNCGTLVVTKENARIGFTGTSLVATQSANSGIGVVTLRASVQDITAVIGDSAWDNNEGNISKAKVRFSWATTGGYTVITGAGTDGQGWINVSLLSPADIKNGTVQLAWTRDIVAATDEQYSIKMEVDGYYTDLDYAVVTVYKPSGDFVTGGGYIKTTQPSGLYAPDLGSRTNFGFNVKYGSGGKNLKGNMNVIFRRTVNGVLRTFQIKANAMTSLGVNITNPNAQTSVFVSKANLQDITNSNAPVSLGGNLTLQVNMTDRGEPGSTDGMAIQLWNGTALWYSSHWMNNDTKEKYLSGGNLKVVSSFNVGTVAPPAPTSINNRAQESLVEAGTFNLKAYPNPAVSQFTLKIESDNTSDKISLRVFDLYGKTVQIFNNVVPNSTMRFGGTYTSGVYFIEMVQGNRHMQLKLMKQ